MRKSEESPQSTWLRRPTHRAPRRLPRQFYSGLRRISQLLQSKTHPTKSMKRFALILPIVLLAACGADRQRKSSLCLRLYRADPWLNRRAFAAQRQVSIASDVRRSRHPPGDAQSASDLSRRENGLFGICARTGVTNISGSSPAQQPLHPHGRCCGRRDQQAEAATKALYRAGGDAQSTSLRSDRCRH